ncbi:hypothetical protein CGZ94_05030 [Enemella evansiae]|uniref:DUF559 domain-containing protein n=1 Tax=Enemella evansiae TaxID=2016499 RepID=A0A255GKF3_9ACTN|nr:DUF559 domain-containing protein [Enemella evansiae]OYO16307.1 hypothetical protein CGZ94_05030 [Enemella evansiae]
MSVVQVLEDWGGVARRSTLIRATARVDVDRALKAGDVVVDARGRYALPTADADLRTANRLHAVLSHRSAAAHWGWEQKFGPKRTEVTVPRNRKLRSAPRAHVHFADLGPDDLAGAVTSRRRTLTDCLRSCAFAEGLAIADSALRNGDISPGELLRLANAIRGPGAAVARRVARHASRQAANPFESVLRAIALDAGLDPEPQVSILRDETHELIGFVDLFDREHRLILEADSYQFHSGRAEFANDCQRYNTFVLAGFRVLRLSWEAVMHHADEVLASLRLIVDGARLPVCYLESA